MKHLIAKEGFKTIITVLSLSFLLSSIFSNSEQLFRQSLDLFGWIYLLFSILITCLSIFINGLAWKYFVNWLGFKPSKLNLSAIFIKTNIFKYLPGGIWHFVSRINSLKSYIDISHSLAAVFLEPFLMLVAASVCITFGDFNFLIKLFFALPIFIFSSFFRKVLVKILNKLIYNKLNKYDRVSLIGFSKTSFKILNSSYPFKPLSFEIIFILLRFYGFWLCLKAFAINEDLLFFDLLAFFAIAWIVGLIVPAAPGGIGVFESTILLLIGSNIAQGPLLASLLSYRIISTISDVITFILASLNKPSLSLRTEHRKY